MKCLVICCDGTWQKASQRFPTNVVKLAQIIQTNDKNLQQPQLLEYSPGIGSGGKLINRLAGGAFGWGIDENIQAAYRFLCLNYDDGDEIYLFGFSRGAYTVRSLAGLMRIAGGLLPRAEVLKVPAVYDIYRSQGRYIDKRHISKGDFNRRELERKKKAMQSLSTSVRSARVTVLGCWETVGALGVPRTIPLLSQLLNKKYEFHDHQLSNIIDHALHAVAIDEMRKVFDFTPMQQSQKNIDAGQTLQQVWFPGDHGAVGGGEFASLPLADGALLWMIDTIQTTLDLGLKFDLNPLQRAPTSSNPIQAPTIRPDPTALVPREPISWLFRLTGLQRRSIPPDAVLHRSVFQRWQALGAGYRPSNLPPELVSQLNSYISA
ncbi:MULTISPECIES: DUF2235 domain-containing protein [Cyanophyceae]|uniref:DUF2235 domain-containing protein n=1 Tax=Cyanophyceae TaxID=3028117 RepID=UPI00168879A1|nr:MULTISPECIES: DUF2235 domain-containing protein [Cyanophyceae]MBD1917303.1 DUF2235 domain-containing protein [Phormidium sp. FACHB-77]MBD2032226.1 DUF2235 domain-containing protein [Phormidium sp. FACHB-322]MBD2053264.1 DUF2235 domain-containing protein [Leptolyngbya sp. FACHB-60]